MSKLRIASLLTILVGLFIPGGSVVSVHAAQSSASVPLVTPTVRQSFNATPAAPNDSAPVDSASELLPAIAPPIIYATEDVNMQIGFILNRWNINPTDLGNANVSLTIWWNNPSEEVFDDATGVMVAEAADDFIRDIWVYQYAFGTSAGGEMGDALDIYAHLQPNHVRGAWVITIPIALGNWYAIKFQDTFASSVVVDGVSDADLTWVIPARYEPGSMGLTGPDFFQTEQKRYSQAITRYALINILPAEYLDPGVHCEPDVGTPLLCELAIIALVREQTPIITQGQRVVLENRTQIAKIAEQYQLPEISLAAGIANQANAITRPFDSDILERYLINLPDGPFTGNGASVGMAQITSPEMDIYLPGCDQECLFDPQKSLELMAAKLSAANDLLPAEIDPTDRLMVLALAQNNGAGPAETYLEYGGDWQQLSELYQQGGYVWDRGDWDQLGKILEILRNLLAQGFLLPDGVDLSRWQQIYQSQGQPILP